MRTFFFAAAILFIATGRLTAQSTGLFSGFQFRTNKEFVFKLSAPANQNYRLETSTNMTDWVGWRTFLMPGIGSIQHTDSAAPLLTARYYRSVAPGVSNLLTGDHLQTSSGDAVIHPLNHRSFVIQGNGLMIYNDPVGGGSLYSAFPKADLILVSHDHSDHFDSSTLSSVKKSNTVIIVTQTIYNSLPTSVKTNSLVLTNGASSNFIGIPVTAVAAYNPSGSYHAKGVGNGYVITLGDRRLYMSGDTEDVTEMKGLQNIDVAFLCMNLPYTMDITHASGVVRVFQPKIVYPYHFRNIDNSYSDLNSFKQKVGTDLGVEVRIRTWY